MAVEKLFQSVQSFVLINPSRFGLCPNFLDIYGPIFVKLAFGFLFKDSFFVDALVYEKIFLY